MYPLSGRRNKYYFKHVRDLRIKSTETASRVRLSFFPSRALRHTTCILLSDNSDAPTNLIAPNLARSFDGTSFGRNNITSLTTPEWHYETV